MWFKKKSQISGFSANTAVDGSDWRTANKGRSWLASYTPPSAADAGNYFYLPALGYYRSGRLDDVGDLGYYWSSSAAPFFSDTAYYLGFYIGAVSVGGDPRSSGYRVGAFE